MCIKCRQHPINHHLKVEIRNMKFGAFLVAAAAAQYAGDGNVSILRDSKIIISLPQNGFM